MADRYYDAQASGANNGTSKIDAFQTIQAAEIAMVGTGVDTLYCSHTSNEVVVGALDMDFGSGNKIVCVDFSGSTPPTSADWTTGCVIELSGNWTMRNSVYVFGVFIDTTGGFFRMDGSKWLMEQCELHLTLNAKNLFITNGELMLVNSIWSGDGTDHEILISTAKFVMHGGSISFGGKLALLIRKSTGMGTAGFRGTDLSNGGSGITALYLDSGGGISWGDVVFDSCNIDPSAIISLGGNSNHIGFYGSNEDDKQYYIQENTYLGTVQSETTIIKTGGSSDGTVPISLKFVGNTNYVSGGDGVYLKMPIHFWVNSTGNQTFELELVTDGITLKENDMVMELLYPQAGEAQKVFASSRTFDNADLPVSIVDWTTTGLGAPVKQKISMIANVGQVGVVQARLRMKRQNTIVYADVKLLDSDRQYVAGQAYINSEAIVCDYPPTGKVIDGTFYDFGNLEGDYKQVPEAQAALGFNYGAGGVEFEGELLTTIKGPIKLLKLDTGIKVIKI